MVMATFGTITDEVARKLAGFTLRQDRQTHLTENVTTSSTTLKIASATNLSTGIVQVDDELIYIDSYDRVNGILTIPPYGRGYNGTKISSHKAGARVVISPTFPNIDIKQAINETIGAVFPKLYVPNVFTFSYVATRSTYALPNEVEKVLSVTFETVGPTKQWMPVRAWRQDTMANTGTFNSRNSITVAGISPGRTVQVFYTAKPTLMDNESDDFELVTGLPLSCKDVIVLGASAKLASFVDPGRLTFGSAEADQQSQIAGRAYGAGTNAAKYLLALYDKRIAEEAAKLNDRNPIRAHYTN
jgi:hypothetical protein